MGKKKKKKGKKRAKRKEEKERTLPYENKYTSQHLVDRLDLTKFLYQLDNQGTWVCFQVKYFFFFGDHFIDHL